MSRTMAFTADVTARLTGLSERQLRSWDVDGFFVPTFANPNRRSPHSRIYSFQDLIAPRTIACIQKQGVPIQRLKKLGEILKTLPSESWSGTRFYVAARGVYFNHADALIVARPVGQQAIREIVAVDL